MKDIVVNEDSLRFDSKLLNGFTWDNSKITIKFKDNTFKQINNIKKIEYSLKKGLIILLDLDI